MVRCEVKGSHILQALRCTDASLGEGTFARLATMIAGGASWSTINVSGWYDVFVLQAVLERVAHETGRSLLTLTKEIARQNALADLTGLYRTFLRIAQPVRMLRFTPQLWRNYARFAHARAEVNEPGTFVASVSELPEPLIEWCCGSSLGFLPTGIQLAGGLVKRAEIVERVVSGEQSSIRIAIDYDMA